MAGDEQDFIPIISDGEEDDLTVQNLPELLPILPLRNTVLFPGVILPIQVGRHRSLKLVREVYKKDGLLGTISFLIGFIMTLYVIIVKMVHIFNETAYRQITDQPLFYLEFAFSIISPSIKFETCAILSVS